MLNGMVSMEMDQEDNGSPVSMMGIEKCKECKDSGPRYPYGLEIRMEKDELEKLDLEDCEVGDKYVFVCKAKVTRTSENESEDNESKSVTFQITNMKAQHLALAQVEEKKYNEKDLMGKAEEIMTGKKGY